MRADEILSVPLLEMSLPKDKAEQRISAVENQINVHLIKLAVVAAGNDRAEIHWRKEVVARLTMIGQIRLKPRNRTASFKFYYNLLFDYTYGENEVKNVAGWMELLSEDYTLDPAVSAESAAERLEVFHRRFASAAEKGNLSRLDLVEMVAAF